MPSEASSCLIITESTAGESDGADFGGGSVDGLPVAWLARLN